MKFPFAWICGSFLYVFCMETLLSMDRYLLGPSLYRSCIRVDLFTISIFSLIGTLLPIAVLSIPISIVLRKSQKESWHTYAVSWSSALGVFHFVSPYLGSSIIWSDNYRMYPVSRVIVAGYLGGILFYAMSRKPKQKKAPNQALEPTTMAVTPAASHPSRQP